MFLLVEFIRTKMEIKKTPKEDIKTVKGVFSQEFFMNNKELASFLRKLADQVESGEDLKIKTEEWILPFPHMSHAKVDVDLDDDELEIEIEFKRKTGKLDIEINKPEPEKTEAHDPDSI